MVTGKTKALNDQCLYWSSWQAIFNLQLQIRGHLNMFYCSHCSVEVIWNDMNLSLFIWYYFDCVHELCFKLPVNMHCCLHLYFMNTKNSCQTQVFHCGGGVKFNYSCGCLSLRQPTTERMRPVFMQNCQKYLHKLLTFETFSGIV